MDNTIKNFAEILEMLDYQFRREKQFWDPFYSDRKRQIPFFVNKADENLVSYINSGKINEGKAMELGCGPGRNSLFLARSGFSVDAFDLSEIAIQWAKERAHEAAISINFRCQSVFELAPKEEYDFIYDSGCMHHLLPHRRVQYIQMIHNGLKPGGYFGLTCFAPGYGDVGGPVYEMTDWDVYQEKSMKGGLAFTEEKLRYILSDHFDCIELRKMRESKAEDETFGVSFLWTSLWRKR